LIGVELLVGAGAFWGRARADALAAGRRLLVQAMTFEGDDAGKAVAQAISASPAADRRVLVDAYSLAVVSDRWVRGPWLAAGLRREVADTDAMFRALMAAGVGVRVANPFTPWLANYPARNHKKLIVADDVVYLGGVNFSDHNFAWRDLMLRIEHAGMAAFLSGDFEATWNGTPVAVTGEFDNIGLRCLDGRTNDTFFAEFADLVGRARSEIVVVSAYLTFPFTEPLALAVKRGVRVRLITPWRNNKPLVRDQLLRFAAKSGFDVVLTPEMSHLKGLVIDNEILVAGSCNFDFAGLAAEEELIAIVADRDLAADFHSLVVAPAEAEAAAPRRVSALRGAVASATLRLAAAFAARARAGPRTAVDWGA
jgi:cardiolipin synthase